jgi:hypothetical protein
MAEVVKHHYEVLSGNGSSCCGNVALRSAYPHLASLPYLKGHSQRCLVFYITSKGRECAATSTRHKDAISTDYFLT